MASAGGMAWRAGGCHCGAVRFEALLPDEVEADDCDCSMCSRTGFLHLIVPQARFRLLSGQDVLTCYQFNTRVAQHLFCSKCGIKSFYVPRSNPDGFSVNARCLDVPLRLTIAKFDGKNWEVSFKSSDGRLAQKSKM